MLAVALSHGLIHHRKPQRPRSLLDILTAAGAWKALRTDQTPWGRK